MKIKELYDCLEQAIGEDKKFGECNIEFWLQLEDEEVMCDVCDVGQYHIIPDMTITVKPESDKIYSTEPLSKEQLDYKKKYEDLKEVINNIRRLI